MDADPIPVDVTVIAILILNLHYTCTFKNPYRQVISAIYIEIKDELKRCFLTMTFQLRESSINCR